MERNKISIRIRFKQIIICCILILSMLMMDSNLQPKKATAVAAVVVEDNYLVLVQNLSGRWTKYEHLVETSPEGNLMVRAKAISKALGFTYTNYIGSKFTIQKSIYRYNAYTKGKTEYSFRCSSSCSLILQAEYKAFNSLKYRWNLIDAGSLQGMINYQFYDAGEAAKYVSAGYDGVLCYSAYGIVAAIPTVDTVINWKSSSQHSDTEPADESSKLILVGDSRINNMSQWVSTCVDTEFIAKAGEGYEWFLNTGIEQVNNIREPGDVILLWLGVNDYNHADLGGNSWELYAGEINSLAEGEWSDSRVIVVETGYVDIQRIFDFYGKIDRANVTQIDSGLIVKGIQDFNEKLKNSLSSKVSWITVNSFLGMNSSDADMTPDNMWVIRDNGLTDGIHYGPIKTQGIYYYFVGNTMY
ncbi:MAG: hypothetical protein WBI07_10845 [Mobilitalea sp.]